MKFSLLFSNIGAIGALSQSASTDSICESIAKMSSDLDTTSACFHGVCSAFAGLSESIRTPGLTYTKQITSGSSQSDISVSALIDCLRDVQNVINDLYAIDTNGDLEKSYPELGTDRTKLQNTLTELEEGSATQLADVGSADAKKLDDAIDMTSQGVDDAKGVFDTSQILEACLSGNALTKRQVESY